MWQHFTILPREMTDYGDTRVDVGRGHWLRRIEHSGLPQIQESDMILMPDAATARIEPLAITPTMTVICDVKDR